MEKSPDAFRTISEVAELLETPAHVLRFWESRFPQVRPVKRAGGRRYYRPTDVALLSGIKRLLHSEGLTIRGVQKVLREHGIRHVMAMADSAVLDGPLIDVTPEPEPDEVHAAASATAPEHVPAPMAEERPSLLVLGQPAAKPAEALEKHEAPADGGPVSEPEFAAAAPDAPALAEPPVQPELPDLIKAAVESAVADEAVRMPEATVAAAPAAQTDAEALPPEWLPTQLRVLERPQDARQQREFARMHGDLQALRSRLAANASGRGR